MKNTIISAFIILGTLSSCNKIGNDPGDLTVEDRTFTDSVTAITSNGSLDVFITHDTSYDIRIEAGSNMMSDIETEVKDNHLEINQRGIYKGNNTVRVYVSVDYLNEVNLKGSGNISGENMNANHVFVNLDGSGDINLEYDSLDDMSIDLDGSGDVSVDGSCTSNTVNLKGSGDINCRYLLSQSCFVDLEGSGDVKIFATSSVTVNVDGSGDVYYYGNPPTVNVTTNGSGNVSAL